jgi:hypothetical protein
MVKARNCPNLALIAMEFIETFIKILSIDGVDCARKRE